MSSPGSHESTTPPLAGRGRSVLLIVTGGIAAYKSCLVLRGLQDAGCRVRVAMTDSATHFITPLTFQALSGQPVGTSLWGEGGEEPLDHIHWAQGVDVVLVAPATANFLAKMAHGIADDLASTLIAAADAPLIVAPAMNDRMWRNPANQENLTTLRGRGVRIIEPGRGWLACGTVAEGRLAEPDSVVDEVLSILETGPLAGRAVLVTAGPTHEPIDAVRYIGNRSSGRMGMALAAVARDLGARVTLLLGPTELAAPDGITVERFETTEELRASTLERAPSAEVVIMSAAVADFRPRSPEVGKRKKADGLPELLLEATPDILAELGARKPDGQLLVGFALEAGSDDQVEQESIRKLDAKALDLVVGNRADVEGEGFGSVTNRVFVVDREGRAQWLPATSKEELAPQIWKRALPLMGLGREADLLA